MALKGLRAAFAEHDDSVSNLSDEKGHKTSHCWLVAGSLAQPGSSNPPFRNTKLTISEVPKVFASNPVPRDSLWLNYLNRMSDPLLVERQLFYNKLQEERIARKKADEKRRENIMSLELAMKREMAYREKIKRLQLQRPSDPMEGSMFSQVPLPSPCSGGSKREIPSINQLHLAESKREDPPSNQLYLRELKSEAPDNHLKWFPPQPPLSHGHQSYLFCKVCQVACSSNFNLKQHYAGNKHMAKVEELKQNLGNGVENCSKSETPKWCKVCEIPCMNEYSLQQHLTGKKHILRLHEIEDAKRARRLNL